MVTPQQIHAVVINQGIDNQVSRRAPVINVPEDMQPGYRQALDQFNKATMTVLALSVEMIVSMML